MLISYELTATTTEQKLTGTINRLDYIINDGTSDIFIGDSPISTVFSSIFNPDVKPYVRLKPGEMISNLNVKVSNIYYKSDSGNQPFRIGGVSR